jgi:hypothetical protein
MFRNFTAGQADEGRGQVGKIDQFIGNQPRFPRATMFVHFGKPDDKRNPVAIVDSVGFPRGIPSPWSA